MAFKYERRSTEAVRKRATQQGGDFQGILLDEFKLFTPKKGDNWVRILPPTWTDPKPTHYGMDFHVHYQIGPDKAAVLCLHKHFDQPCPICEARMRAERDGDEDLAKALKISRRVGVWMVDLKDEAKGPQVWTMPWTVDRDLAKISEDKRTGEVYLIDDPDDGYDVSFEREGDGLTTKYTGMQLARKPSGIRQSWLDFVVEHPLPDTLMIRDYEEVAKLYSGGLAPSERGGSDRDDDRRRDRGPGDRERDDDRRPSRGRDSEDDRDADRGKSMSRDDRDDYRPVARDRDRDGDERPARREREREVPREDDEVEAPAPSTRRRPPPVDEKEDAPPPASTRRRPPPPADDEEDAPPPRREAPGGAGGLPPSSSGGERSKSLRERFAARQAGG